jgi:putative cell wall-binding protein
VSPDGRARVTFADTSAGAPVDVGYRADAGSGLPAVELSTADGSFPPVEVQLSGSVPDGHYACIVLRAPDGADRVSRCVAPQEPGELRLAARDVTLRLPISEAGEVVLVAFARGDVRLAGVTRVETAAQAAVHGWDTAHTVLLASAGAFPDALAAAPLAGALDAPLLLTDRERLPDATEAELRRLQPTRVIVVGGTATVSDDVVAEVGALGVTVTRIAGAERTETAERVAAELGDGSGDGLAVVASARSFPDALAAAPVAGQRGLPVYLAEPAGLSPSTLDAMRAAGVTRTLVVGGAAAIDPRVETQLAAAGMGGAERLAGADRYGTAVAVANWAAGTGSRTDEVLLATGADFPDALAAGALGARAGRLVLLVAPGSSMRDQPAGEFLTTRPDVALLVVLGGPAAVPPLVLGESSSEQDTQP